MVGVARDDEPRTIARGTGAPRRGTRDARRNLRLVHRGLRQRRPERRQGAAGRTPRRPMICAKCHSDNLADAVFCAECGARMEQACSACGTTNPPNSIAVLPFTNLSGDPQEQYFSDGITGDIITALSRSPDLFVIDRASSFSYKGKPMRVQEVSRELGVKYVLEGGVQKAGGQLRVTAQLVDATSGAELWAERYDRPLRDVFSVQDEIVRRIV